MRNPLQRDEEIAPGVHLRMWRFPVTTMIAVGWVFVIAGMVVASRLLL